MNNSINFWFTDAEVDQICAKYHQHTTFGSRARKDENGQPLSGIFDSLHPETDQQRQVYMRGGCVFIVDRMTIEANTRLTYDWEKLPWGSFPDLPKKK